MKTILALAKVVSNIHNAGYLHLDIKPENFLVIPETRELVRLFDFDTVISLEDIRNGKIKAMSYSQGWSAPEQAQGNISKLSFSADIYAIGAILFYKIFGRKPDNADRSQFTTWDFDVEMFDGINPKVKRLLSILFSRTISANPQRRFQKADELINAVQNAIDTLSEKRYLISNFQCSGIKFIGREAEIDLIHGCFNNDGNVAFLFGMGDIGKSEIAFEYIKRYKNEYDSVVLYRYANVNLDKAIQSISYCDGNDMKKIESFDELFDLCSNSKVLLVFDGVDNENDPYLPQLLQTKADLIITTRVDFRDKFNGCGIAFVSVNTMKQDELLGVFASAYRSTIKDNDKAIILKIINSVGGLTGLIPIIAKSIYANGMSFQEYYEQLEENERYLFEDDIAVVDNIGKTTANNHVRRVFSLAYLNDEQLHVLKLLSILHYHKHLTKKEFIKYVGRKNLNALNSLISSSWVKYSYDSNDEEDEEKELIVTLHDVILEFVQNENVFFTQEVPELQEYIHQTFDSFENVTKHFDDPSYHYSFDDLKPFTFAFLMYSDIAEYDDEQRKYWQRLFSCWSVLFSINPNKLYDLIFSTPDESGWHMNVDWVVETLQSNTVKSFISIKQINDMITLFQTGKLDGATIVFDSEEEKQNAISDVLDIKYAFLEDPTNIICINVLSLFFTARDCDKDYEKDYDVIVPYINNLVEIENAASFNKVSNDTRRWLIDMYYLLLGIPDFNAEITDNSICKYCIPISEMTMPLFEMVYNVVSSQLSKNIDDDDENSFKRYKKNIEQLLLITDCDNFPSWSQYSEYWEKVGQLSKNLISSSMDLAWREWTKTERDVPSSVSQKYIDSFKACVPFSQIRTIAKMHYEDCCFIYIAFYISYQEDVLKIWRRMKNNDDTMPDWNDFHAFMNNAYNASVAFQDVVIETEPNFVEGHYYLHADCFHEYLHDTFDYQGGCLYESLTEMAGLTEAKAKEMFDRIDTKYPSSFRNDT